jgi:hypothetical protein
MGSGWAPGVELRAWVEGISQRGRLISHAETTAE